MALEALLKEEAPEQAKESENSKNQRWETLAEEDCLSAMVVAMEATFLEVAEV